MCTRAEASEFRTFGFWPLAQLCTFAKIENARLCDDRGPFELKPQGKFCLRQIFCVTELEWSGKNQILRSARAQRGHFSEFRFFTPRKLSDTENLPKDKHFPCGLSSKRPLLLHNLASSISAKLPFCASAQKPKVQNSLALAPVH